VSPIDVWSGLQIRVSFVDIESPFAGDIKKGALGAVASTDNAKGDEKQEINIWTPSFGCHPVGNYLLPDLFIREPIHR